MPPRLPARLAAAVLLVTAAVPGCAPSTRAPDQAEDPYLWLEDVTAERSLGWVRERNAASEAALASTPEFRRLEGEIRAVLDSDARIPSAQKMGDYYYDFWKDARHERGIWRRTTLAEFRKPEPKWETILDLDALNRAEGENWVWHNADCLEPAYERCLIALSRGGADADVTREFDLTTKSWVKDGFFRPEAKGQLTWIDRDNVFVTTDLGPGTTSTSGYAIVVKQWRRGTPIGEATEVFRGETTDMRVVAYRQFTPGFERDLIRRTIAFYDEELHVRGADGQLRKVDVPNSADASLWREWLLVMPRDPWTVDGRTYPAGALLAARFDDYMAGRRELQVLFEPTATTSLSHFVTTKGHVVLNVLDDVKSRLSVLTPANGEWKRSPFVGAPEMGTVWAFPVDADESDALWLHYSDFLTPSTLALAEIGKAPEVLKRTPPLFDATGLVAEQHFATSEDGTRVPYFVVRREDRPLDGTAPTLLYGYGGFEISMLPDYSATVGKGWLERGGVYVVANIRGGGEYGPRWHQAALKEKRHKAYEDFAAVARDLVARRITSRERLGISGGSNGGLLTGNMLTQYPELFGAVVVEVPLLDMKRYSHLLAGASWMAEYGDPDTDDWQFIRTFSPYHLFDAARDYPPTLITTSTRDDRVHPGHARKMAAKMLDAGKPVLYYENIEGGHGGAANNAQAAYKDALAFTFLWRALGGTPVS